MQFIDKSLFQRSAEDALEIDAALGDFASNLHSRLLRSRELRTSRTETVVNIQPVILWLGPQATQQGQFESRLCGSLEGLLELIQELEHEPLTAHQIAEVRSVVEGSKALSRPQKRIIENAAAQPLAVAMQVLESEITNFDQKQRHIALVDVGGPARIRGLAGSGKTVILAMKAAHLHLNNPEANILVTFYTRSLQATIKLLITRFYRHYSETDPDWKRLHIRHGWGGSTTPGVSRMLLGEPIARR